MKQSKIKIINSIFVFILFIQILYPICISNADDTDNEDIYDVVLFWGQSNMTGYCGTEDGEKVKDTRYDYTNTESVKEYSKKTGIDENILSNSVKMNYVKVAQEPQTAYEYYYIGNKLQELDENTQFCGEKLMYNSSTKKLEQSTGSYSIQKSYGTNVIPQFCKTYYNKTHHKVVAVMTANGGEAIANFLPSNDSDYGDSDIQLIYEAMVEKYNAAIKCLQDKGYKIGNRLWVSFQGEADVRTTSKDRYKQLFLKVKNYLKRDLNITKGAIIETAHTIGNDLYSKINIIKGAQAELASENNDIIIGSSYAYDRYVPNESIYNSSSYTTKIFVDSSGNKLPYSTAFNYASGGVCYTTSNTIHFTSAALSQIGMEAANSLAEELRDKVAPQVQVGYSTTQLTNRNVDVTLTANEKIKPIEGWTISEDKKKLTKTYSANKTEEITVYDLAGNSTKVNIDIKNIDKTGPTVQVSYSIQQMTNGNVEVTLTANEKIKEIEGWTLSQDKKKLTKTYSENKTEEITVYDLVGNSTKVNIEINNIDKTSLSVQVSYSTKTLTNSSVTVTLTANKEILEVEGWTLSQDKKQLTKTYNANKTEEVAVRDKYGNEVKVMVEVNNIDKTTPDIQVNYSTKSATKDNVIVTIVSNKELQEVEGWTISEDKKKLTKIYYENKTEEVKIYDMAGNENKVLIEVNNIEKTGVDIQVNYSTTKTTNQDVTVTITSNEELREIEGWTLSQDKKKLTKTYSANKTEEITVCDILGNEKKITISINNIDKTELEIQIRYSNTQITNQNVVVEISANKEIRESEGWKNSEDRKKITKTYSENKNEEVTVYDVAGNSKKANINITNIDKQKPVVQITYSTQQATNKDVVVEMISNEDVQNIEGWEKKNNNNKILTKTYKDNKKETISVYDIAGNKTEVEINISNIDRTPPTVNVNYNTNQTTNGDVIVTISSNKEVQEVDGWELSSDKKTLTKNYSSNATDEVVLYDLAGNSEKVIVEVNNIDKGNNVTYGDSETYDNSSGKTLPKVLPNTGIKTIIWIILALTTIAVVYYIKNKKMKDIK